MEINKTKIELHGNLRQTENYMSTTRDGAVKLRLGTKGISALEPVTIPQYFRSCCKQYESCAALAFKKKLIQGDVKTLATCDDTTLQCKNWTMISYGEYAAKVEQVTLMLLHLGLAPHASIGILAHNCPEWYYIEFGAWRAGGIVFGIYPSSSVEAVHHMLYTAEATMCVVDNAEQMAKVHAVRARLPKLRVIIQLDGPFDNHIETVPHYYRWSELLNLNFGASERLELQRRESTQYANEAAMLVFTSGTVGMPKAVLLSHDNIVFNVKSAYHAQPNIVWGEGRRVSYLPLSHIAAQSFEVFGALHTGACVYFADRDALKGTLIDTLIEVKPTAFLGVPRIYEKLRDRLSMVENYKGSFSKCVENTARQSVHLNNHCYRNCETRVPLKDTLANYIVNNTRREVGLEDCKIFYSGAAPLAEEVKQFFFKFDVTIIDGYGLSEVAGAATLNRAHWKLNSVGKPIDGTELMISRKNCNDADGEILFRGRHVFMGYLNEIEKTMATIDNDGWLHTGDLGFTDEEGFLINTGRIKELIITAGGENIAPVPIENAIKYELPIVSNAMVVGDGRKFLSVLLTIKTNLNPSTALPTDILHPDAVNWLKSLGLNYTSLSAMLDVLEEQGVSASIITESISAGLGRVNVHALSHAQRVQKFLLLRHDFSTATGEIGPSLKLRRNFVLEKYAHKINKIYEQIL